MGKVKKAKVNDQFQSAVSYLTEYSGVKGVVIVDSEGLVLAAGGTEGFEAEKFAAYSQEIIGAVRGTMRKLLVPKIDCLGIKTPTDWLTIAVAHPLVLVVAADRHADELLNIRIARSLEMISAKLKERYSRVSPSDSAKKNNAKSLEAMNV